MSGNAQMFKVFIVCEGQTEETFVNNIVAPSFYPLGITLIPQLIETSPGHKGGALSYPRVHRYLRNTLRGGNQRFVTTMIDLYKLDSGFPGFAEAQGKPLDQRLNILKAAWHRDIIDSVGCRADRFLPYIQPYEFEALLFSDVTQLTSIDTGWANAVSPLQSIRDSVESPEHIDEGAQTKPAARLAAHLKNPNYSKVLHGYTAAERITLAKIEAECHFFAAWLEQLRKANKTP